MARYPHLSEKSTFTYLHGNNQIVSERSAMFLSSTSSAEIGNVHYSRTLAGSRWLRCHELFLIRKSISRYRRGEREKCERWARFPRFLRPAIIVACVYANLCSRRSIPWNSEEIYSLITREAKVTRVIKTGLNSSANLSSTFSAWRKKRGKKFASDNN